MIRERWLFFSFIYLWPIIFFLCIWHYRNGFFGGVNLFWMRSRVFCIANVDCFLHCLAV
jgi:hypothetical protein